MNVTLSIDDDLVEKAREVARRQGTSLNALIRGYLESLTGQWSGEQIVAAFEALWAEPQVGDSGGWKFDRDEIYADRVSKARR